MTLATAPIGGSRLSPARRWLGRAARAVSRDRDRPAAAADGGGGGGHDRVSLVLVCEEADLPRLSEVLDSVAAEHHPDLEVLLAPVGEAAATGASGVLASRAGDGVRLLPQLPTWAEAAEAGVAAATGRHLAFQRGCDRRVGASLSRLGESLAGSGSDLAVGRLLQRGRGEAWLTRTVDAVHTGPGRALPPGDRPALAGSLALADKLFVTDHWRAHARLGGDDGWLLSPAVAGCLASAGAVDVVDVPTVEHAADHGTRAFAAMPSPLPGLAAWHARADRVGDDLAGTPWQPGWRHHVADVALPGLLLDTERATDAQWAELAGLAADAEERAPDPGTLTAASRTLLRLAAAGRRADVEALAAELHEAAGDLPTRLPDGAAAPVVAWRSVDVPDEVARLAPTETLLHLQLHRLRELPGGDREVEVLARVGGLDLGAVAPEVSAAGGARVLDHRVDPVATRWGGSRFRRALLVTVRVPAGAGQVRLRLVAGALSREAELDVVAPHSRPADPDRGVEVTDVRLDGPALVLGATGSTGLRLVGDDGTVLPLGAGPEPRAVLEVDRAGRRAALPTGFYRVLADPTGGRDGRLPVLADDLLDRLPLEQVGEHHRLRASVGPRGGLVLHLGPPLADDELGPWAQERLREAYLASTDPPDPDLAYFESFVGRSATDSPHGIHDELRRRRPDVTTAWGVSDHAQWVPPGAEPVLLGSRRWYDVLARAGLVVTNTDVEAWFRRRPGQHLCQTFHGYPAKGMGRGQWEAMELPPRQVRVLRRRGVDSWSSILTPSAEMTRHYREQYGYDGPAIEAGYPRDDDLVRPAPGRRERVREELGLAPHQTAVLYAPTWREHLATRHRAAERTTFLDLDAATDALGPDHVVLVRGHRFHRPGPSTARYRDVTAHPEVNDLLLAADVVVLDYSSLRFDVALTGTPMVFLVPDLDDYASGTRAFLFPFEDSAPGPLVADTAGVVEAVRDVPALRAQWAGAIEEFTARYHPWRDGRAAERVVEALLTATGHDAQGGPHRAG